ncbi:hypothetical protein BUALT_Bualt16G0077500 [Buddleja alternifolia]|uniref:Zinc finger PMZ-type domain-containing protein n=1 Tax=Buddleja alternifolia TaxID=168488 RepID=A0AAV6WAK9_9LAMI|nr:hypothetical protein BUALT_Bualt16G0077500 [Buddleja alternifolia]
MDEDFFEQLYNDENFINEAVDLNNEFEDGAWGSVSDEGGQNDEGVGGVNENGHPQEGLEASQSGWEQHDPTFQRDEYESDSDSSSISYCPSWMLEDLEGPDDEDDIFQERPPDHAKKLFKRRVNEDGWYSDVEEENENVLGALGGSDEESERHAEWNDDMERRGVNLFVGLQFASRKKYKEVLKDWVVKKGWDLKFLKSERGKVTAICKNGCDWRIHASPVMQTTTYQIKSIKGKHICNHRTDSKQADYKYIGKRIQHFIKDNPNEGLESLKNKIRRDVLVECSMHKVYMAKRYALELLRGDVKEQYNRLYDYCATVVKHNPNSTMVLKIDRSLTPLVLERMYCCLSGCKEGLLDGCRPIIGLDGRFLKGLYKGQLSIVVGRDGNDNLVPIVYTMVEVEKFGSHEDRDWAFISDRQKGLVEAVAKVAPRAQHRFCVRHMYNNFKATFKGVELKQLFWKAASTYNVRQHLRVISEIQRLYPKKETKQTPYEWLNVIHAAHWARELPIIEMFEWIRKKCTTRIQIKRDGMEKYAGIYGSCGMFRLVGYPCCHAVTSIASLRLDIENYVDDCFKKETYLRVYSHMVNPVPGMHDFEDSVLGTVDPPHIRILPGRPKKNATNLDITNTQDKVRYPSPPPQAADEDAYMPHNDSESAATGSTANPPPQSEAGTSTEMPSASQPRRQAASQPVRSQNASQQVRRQTGSQSRARQPTWRPTGASASNQMPFVPSQPVTRQSASQLVRRQSTSQPLRRQIAPKQQMHQLQLRRKSASQPPTTQIAPGFRSASQTSQEPTVGGQTTNQSAHKSFSHLPAFEVPTFGGEATTISNLEGPPMTTQSQASQVLKPTPNPAFKKPTLTSSMLRSISASYRPRAPTTPSASSNPTQEAASRSPKL